MHTHAHMAHMYMYIIHMHTHIQHTYAHMHAHKYAHMHSACTAYICSHACAHGIHMLTCTVHVHMAYIYAHAHGIHMFTRAHIPFTCICTRLMHTRHLHATTCTQVHICRLTHFLMPVWVPRQSSLPGALLSLCILVVPWELRRLWPVFTGIQRHCGLQNCVNPTHFLHKCSLLREP